MNLNLDFWILHIFRNSDQNGADSYPKISEFGIPTGFLNSEKTEFRDSDPKIVRNWKSKNRNRLIMTSDGLAELRQSSDFRKSEFRRKKPKMEFRSQKMRNFLKIHFE